MNFLEHAGIPISARSRIKMEGITLSNAPRMSTNAQTTTSLDAKLAWTKLVRLTMLSIQEWFTRNPSWKFGRIHLDSANHAVVNDSLQKFQKTRNQLIGRTLLPLGLGIKIISDWFHFLGNAPDKKSLLYIEVKISIDESKSMEIIRGLIWSQCRFYFRIANCKSQFFFRYGWVQFGANRVPTLQVSTTKEGNIISRIQKTQGRTPLGNYNPAQSLLCREVRCGYLRGKPSIF